MLLHTQTHTHTLVFTGDLDTVRVFHRWFMILSDEHHTKTANLIVILINVYATSGAIYAFFIIFCLIPISHCLGWRLAPCSYFALLGRFRPTQECFRLARCACVLVVMARTTHAHTQHDLEHPILLHLPRCPRPCILFVESQSLLFIELLFPNCDSM